MVPSIRAARPVLLLLLAAACADPSAPFQAGPQFNKGKGGSTRTSDPTVSAVDPAYGRQGDVIDGVRILGSNFTEGAQVAWERNGVPDPRITVRGTRYVSPTEVHADITIQSDAEIAFYDVAVMSGGKRGVGIESFEVTAAYAITGGCAGIARGASDTGQIVGDGCQTAFYWESGLGVVSLGPGIATAMDGAGTTIIGAAWSGTTATQEGPALIWTRNGSEWNRAELPSSGLTARATALASRAGGAPDIIAGQYRQQINRKTTNIRPVIWQRTGAQWTMQTLPVPQAVASQTVIRATGVSDNGRVAGAAYTSNTPIVWEPGANGAYQAIVLQGSGLAIDISRDGEMIVGQAGGVAAYWKRAGSTWTGPYPLSTCGSANTINADGLIAGRSCKGAAAWRVSDGGVVTEILLGSLGRNTGGEVHGASRTHLVGVSGNAAYWLAFF